MLLIQLFKILLFLFAVNVEGLIHKYVKHYNTLHISELSHHIVKRGLKESSHPFNKIKEVKFRTLGRDFRLILTPKRDVLHSKFEAISVDSEGKETPVPVDHENFYSGRLFGETSSHASVHLEDGLMTASIHLPDETYHIEPSWRHLPHLDNQTMITYRASDVDLSRGENSGTERKPCSFIKEGTELETDEDDLELDEDSNFYENDGPRVRAKRHLTQYEYMPAKTRCPLLLVADYRFFQEMGGSNIKTTINYLISLIDRVHKIYNDTIWQDRQDQEGFKGMGFVIKKIVVHSEPTRVRGGEAHYNMVREKWDVRNLLEVFASLIDGKTFCLGHLFTHQTFVARDATVLGLAYIASSRSYSVGGICTQGDSNMNLA